MSRVRLKIKEWGNNLGVRLPAIVAREAHLHNDQEVEIVVQGRSLVITPLTDEPTCLEDLLKSFDPARHGGEHMQASESLGAERW